MKSIYDKVWVAPDLNNLKGPQSYFATLYSKDNGVCKVNDGKGYKTVSENNVFNLIPCPIDESSNLHTDWIDDELLVDTAPGHNDTIMGWLLDNGEYYSVICEVRYWADELFFQFHIRSPWEEKAIPNIVLRFLNKIFNHCSENDIIYNYSRGSDWLIVGFYWIDKERNYYEGS